jgi:hypothetical protein
VFSSWPNRYITFLSFLASCHDPAAAARAAMKLADPAEMEAAKTHWVDSHGVNAENRIKSACNLTAEQLRKLFIAAQDKLPQFYAAAQAADKAAAEAKAAEVEAQAKEAALIAEAKAEAAIQA